MKRARSDRAGETNAGLPGSLGCWEASRAPIRGRRGRRPRKGFKYRDVRANAVIILPIEVCNRAITVTFDPKPGDDVEKYVKMLLEIAG